MDRPMPPVGSVAYWTTRGVRYAAAVDSESAWQLIFDLADPGSVRHFPFPSADETVLVVKTAEVVLRSVAHTPFGKACRDALARTTPPAATCSGCDHKRHDGKWCDFDFATTRSCACDGGQGSGTTPPAAPDVRERTRELMRRHGIPTGSEILGTGELGSTTPPAADEDDCPDCCGGGSVIYGASDNPVQRCRTCHGSGRAPAADEDVPR